MRLASSSFSRLTAAELYATFTRPKFEYSLVISTFLKKDLQLLEKARDTFLPLAFGDRKTSFTATFKHMTNLPSMTDRVQLLIWPNPEKAQPVLVAAYRRALKVNPILHLLMSVYTRSRLRRWHMSWPSARKIVCSRCGAAHASHAHLIVCLDVSCRLGVPSSAMPNPLNYFLNAYFPEKKSKLNTPLTPLEMHLCQY
ncbi:hypothetical protein K501DRAFT_277919 [Backusella circina FSU 941]|nr:hypothetical protein K501DRAFT_277919 [Backusella circina FSU 941]